MEYRSTSLWRFRIWCLYNSQSFQSFIWAMLSMRLYRWGILGRQGSRSDSCQGLNPQWLLLFFMGDWNDYNRKNVFEFKSEEYRMDRDNNNWVDWMEGLRLTLQDIDLFIKETKAKQQEQAKSVRNIYKEFIQRNQPDFSKVVKRIESNLKAATQQSLSNNVYNINIQQAIEKFKMDQLSPIDKQIQQSRVIINKGVGTVHKREFIPSKTQKIEADQLEQKFTKTYAGFESHEKGSYNQSEDLEIRVQPKKYDRQAQRSIIKIQRWWRQFRPETPIYKHDDYFD